MHWSYHDFPQHMVDVNLKGRVRRTLLQEVLFFFHRVASAHVEQQWISSHEHQFLCTNTVPM